VVQVHEPGSEVLERLLITRHHQLLVVDADGRPAGVLLRDDVWRAVHPRPHA
jgi:CBS domain-containing protein